MNANELADCLEDDDWYNNPFANKAAKQAANMLRQQADKIAELEYLNNEHRGVIGILMDEREVLREKIAELEGEVSNLKHMNKNWQISENILLLELEKLQHRELTDEEIRQCILEYFESPEYKQYPLPVVSVNFARAILRKASEK